MLFSSLRVDLKDPLIVEKCEEVRQERIIETFDGDLYINLSTIEEK